MITKLYVNDRFIQMALFFTFFLLPLLATQGEENPLYSHYKAIAMKKEAIIDAFQAQILDALEESEISPQEIVESDCKICLMIKIYGDFIYDKLKRFVNLLDKSKLKYNSSFSPKKGIMNISIFKE